MVKWFPPAESKIPLLHLLYASLPGPGSFEEELKEYLGVGQCFLGNSARSLLFLLLERLKEKDGKDRKEVLIPGYTCYSLAASIVKAGLRIRIYDLDPGSFAPDLDSVRANIGPETLAIVSQHLFGIPAQLDGIVSLSHEAGIVHIEDGAQGLGASLSGRKVGLWGDFGLFSFGRGKPLPLGSGGALVSLDNPAVEGLEAVTGSKGYDQLAATACIQILSHPRLYGCLEALPLGLGRTVFDPGFKAASMPAAMGRLGRISMGSLRSLNEHRNRIARIYRDILPEEMIVPVPVGADPIFTRYPIMIQRPNISKSLTRLGARRMYPNAVVDAPEIQPYLSDHGYKTPGASSIAERLVTLPTHKGISSEIAERIAGEVRNEFCCRIYTNPGMVCSW